MGDTARHELPADLPVPLPLAPATELYAKQFYDKLVELSTLEVLDNLTESSGTEVRVFRGKVSEVFEALGLSQVYYSRIRKIFIKYDCVTYVQRGTRSYDSVLVLHRPPPENLPEEDLTSRPGDATLTALNERVEALERSVKILESKLGGLNIVEALRNFEGRLRSLENGDSNGRSSGKTEKQT
jgi:hypothetical protein